MSLSREAAGSPNSSPCDLRRRDSRSLSEAWADFLGRWSWEWFATLTFRQDAVHPERAEKLFRVWIARVNAAAFGPRWRRQGKSVLWARGTEFQRRGTVHFHVLMSRVGNVRRLSMMDEWKDLAGWARIRPVKAQDRVRKYVSKYATKGGEIDLSDGLADAEPPPSFL